MKRAKIKGKSNEVKMKKKYTKEAVDFTTLLMEVAARDVFDATEEDIQKWKETVNRYAKFIAEGKATVEDLKKSQAKGQQSRGK